MNQENIKLAREFVQSISSETNAFILIKIDEDGRPSYCWSGTNFMLSHSLVMLQALMCENYIKQIELAKQNAK